MKGIVFTEFFAMVEERYSADMVDDLVEECALASGGAYTAVGTYDHGEIVQLVGALSRRTGLAPAALVKAFGEYLFGRFLVLYPQFFQDHTTAFGFLASVHIHVHREVLKLYPDAQLPSFESAEQGPDAMSMVYRSSRGLADLAEGLIRATIAHYGHPIDLAREPVGDGGAHHVLFTLRRAA